MIYFLGSINYFEIAKSNYKGDRIFIHHGYYGVDSRTMNLVDRFIVDMLPWMLSSITLYMNFLAGNLSKHAWLLGCLSQIGWSVWTIYTKEWGFLPLNLGLWYIYIRNYIKWNKQ